MLNDWKPDKEYKKLGVTAFFVVAGSLLFYFLLFKTASIGNGIAKVLDIINPIIYGFIIAYILNPVVQTIENGIFELLKKAGRSPKNKGSRYVRIISAFLTVILLLLFLYALFAMVIPQLINSIRSIVVNFPTYVRNINDFIDNIIKDEDMDATANELINQYASIAENWVSNSVTPRLESFMTNLTSSVLNVLEFFKNFFLGVIISIYVIIAKDALLARGKRLVYSLFSLPTSNRILYNLRFVNEKFGGFLIGKVIDSVIIGMICYVATSILRMPYAVLISVFVGITNVIPFFGPFIGAVPSVFLIFVVNPLQALYFIIFIIILQQFDGNFLGPRILGNSVGVSSFMVIVAILVGSGFFGVIGMIVGVPVCAVLLALLQTQIIRRMRKKQLPTDVESYRDLERIDPETGMMIHTDHFRESGNLYESISRKSPAALEARQPIKDNPWDITEKDLERIDRMIYGSKGKQKKEQPENSEDIPSSGRKQAK